MSDPRVEVPTDASAATDRDTWLALIDAIGEEEGYFQTVGPRHWAMFVDDSPTLLVTFETLDQCRARPGQMPLAHALAAANGWSHLCLISDGQTWFRDPAVYGYFDRLVDDAFFEDFDRVLFYGAGPGSHPACAYSVASPGARVLALNPVATLDPAQSGWDDRYRADRRRDFTSRYGYAPDMVEGAAQVTLVLDPAEQADAIHAALFHSPHIATLPARMAGAEVEPALARLGVLDPMIIAAMHGTLTRASFATLWRKRRDDGPYLRTLMQETATSGHVVRELAVCRVAAKRIKSGKVRKRLAELTALQEAGVKA